MLIVYAINGSLILSYGTMNHFFFLLFFCEKNGTMNLFFEYLETVSQVLIKRQFKNVQVLF